MTSLGIAERVAQRRRALAITCVATAVASLHWSESYVRTVAVHEVVHTDPPSRPRVHSIEYPDSDYKGPPFVARS